MSNPVTRKAAPVNKEEEEERLRSELFGGVKPKSPVVPPVAPPPPETKNVKKEDEEDKSRVDLLGTKEQRAKMKQDKFQAMINPTATPTDAFGDLLTDDTNLDLDNLNLTNAEEEIDFNDLESELTLLKENPEILKKFYEGEDLKEHIHQMDKNLREVETGTILDYIKEGKTIASLYNQITTCDSILEGMENLLTKFQLDINNIGTQIKTLQDACLSKQIRINNRQAVQQRLLYFMDGVTVPDSLAESISIGEVNEAYLEYLTEFNKKMTFIENQKATSPSRTLLAVQEIEPRIYTLRDRAVNKIKQFLYGLIGQCRYMDKIKQSHKELIKYSYLYQFLFKHVPAAAMEVLEIYQDALQKTYLNYFKTLTTIGARLQYEIATRNDLIGVEENKTTNFLTGKRTIKHKTSVFAMGVRQRIIDELETFTGSIDMFNSNDRQPYEFIFRNSVYILMDKVKDEIMFAQDFFLFADMSQLTNEIFGKTIAIYNENLDGWLANSFDAVQVLLMVVVTQKCKQIMSKKLVPVLDTFFDSVYMRLTRSFFNIFELNFQSIKNAAAKDLNSGDLRPHYVTRRYAEFTVALLYLSLKTEYMGDAGFVKKLTLYLSRLREEMEKLLIRLADARFKDWKSKTIFLINNYDLILSVYQEREVTSGDSAQFQKLLDIKTNDYAQEELRNSFGKLLNFVKENAHAIKEDSNSEGKQEEKKLNVREEEVDLLLREFNTAWKGELDKINNTIIQQFSNFKCGMKLFQTIMEDLLEAYTIFVKIIRKYYKNLRMSKHFVPETEMTYEMKKLYVKFD